MISFFQGQRQNPDFERQRTWHPGWKWKDQGTNQTAWRLGWGQLKNFEISKFEFVDKLKACFVCFTSELLEISIVQRLEICIVQHLEISKV